MQILWKLVSARDHHSVRYLRNRVYRRILYRLSSFRILFQLWPFHVSKIKDSLEWVSVCELYPGQSPDCNKRDWCRAPPAADSRSGAGKGWQKRPGRLCSGLPLSHLSEFRPPLWLYRLDTCIIRAINETGLFRLCQASADSWSETKRCSWDGR